MLGDDLVPGVRDSRERRNAVAIVDKNVGDLEAHGRLGEPDDDLPSMIQLGLARRFSFDYPTLTWPTEAVMLLNGECLIGTSLRPADELEELPVEHGVCQRRGGL